MKLSLLGLALVAMVALSGAVPDSASTDQITATTATHTVTLQYLDSRGPYRRATITVEPVRRGARAPWRGDLQRVYIAGLRPASPRAEARARENGYPRIAEFLSSGHSSGVMIYAPAPQNLKRIWFRGERGSMTSVRIRTRNHNPSTHNDEDPPADPPKDDPPKDDPPTDDPPDDDGGDDECGPIPPGCDVYNPWTCQCDIGLEDPWGEEAQTEGSTTSFGF
ncbi:MAG: hypothetical protein AAF791_10020 [Bacteroidota bacterium]